MKHKYGAKPTEYLGIRFASKKEAVRYAQLETLKKSGEVLVILRQVPFHLPGNVKYICDFQVFWANDEVTFEDVKGFATAIYKAKKKMVEELYYPITITEI